MIEVEGLSYTYHGAERPALAGIDLAVLPGEFVIVTGPSGCGKSTLGLALGGYLFQQYKGQAEGRIRVGEIDVRHAPIYEVSEVVGLVQQNPEAQFCTLTVQDEVAFGLENRCLSPAEIRQRLAWALDTVGATHLLDRTLHTLSGGEKQKVAVASVMALQPQVLILDEPTSNLDPRATREIFDVIAAIRAATGMTVIVIEHKLDYLREFDPRVIWMDAGRVQQDALLRKIPSGAGNAMRRWTPTRRPEAAAVATVTELGVQVQGHGPILEDVTFSITPGERVAVMGDNGSGKTTLLRAMLGLQQPSWGTVAVLGRSTRETPVSQLARDVGFVFQNPDHQLFADSVWEEAATGPRNAGTLSAAAEREIERLLDHAGLGSRSADHPYRLSYGEKRRLNLISVLACRPHLLLLDEILIGQDAANAAYLLELLVDAAGEGTAVVMVNHTPQVTQQWAERLLFLERGRLVIDAPVAAGFRELTASGYAAYVPRSTPLLTLRPRGRVSEAV
jgi:energy-coupling factor transport system ATP-binding protein